MLIKILLYFIVITETRNISYTIGATVKIYLTPINYSLCDNAAMKLSYQPKNSDDSDVGILLYNILYGPTVDTVVKSVNTTKYGFKNFTSRRNETSLCLHFSGISVIANKRKYEVHQICDVKKLHLEKKHSLIFCLGENTLQGKT